MSQPRILHHDPRFTVPSLNGFNCVCDLKVCQNDKDEIVVIASEIITKDGDYTDCVSVTNACEDIATAVKAMGYNFAHWVEHYPPRLPKLRGMFTEKEEWSLVEFSGHDHQRIGGVRYRDYQNPDWHFVTREEIETLLGQTIAIPEPIPANKRSYDKDDDMPQQESGAVYHNCKRCKRPLSDPHSMKIGFGPICARKQAWEDNKAETQAYHQVLNEDVEESGFILSHTSDGRVATNVPWTIRHHSPTGFAWGYTGSGPADLALNILQCTLTRMGYKGQRSEKLYDGSRAFQWAMYFHQDFKEEFIANLPPAGGVIPYHRVESWINIRMQAGDALSDAKADEL